MGSGGRAILWLLLFATGCAGGPGPLTDGLKTAEFRLSEDSAAGLLMGGKEKEFIAASLWLEGTRIPGQLSLAGQHSLDHPKKSLQFEATGETPLGFRSMKLSAQVRDHSFLRSLLGERIYAATGLSTPRIEPVVVYLNRQHQGLYLLIERVTPEFYLSRGGRIDRLYKSRLLRSTFTETMIADPRSGVEAVRSPFNEKEIRRLALWANSAPSPESLAALEAGLELESMLRYFGATTFLWNCDGLDNNLRIAHTPASGKLSFTPWDWDMSYSPLCGFEALLAKNRLLAKLLEYPALRLQFKQILSRLSGEFPLERVEALLEADFHRIQGAYARDRTLGGGGRDASREKEELKRLHRGWREQLDAFLGAS
ncbi:MAG: CotH kinase family protein [Oligoflexia bacterium]|nr:CotH kinase family protein [Oligoflexia bacterium]